MEGLDEEEICVPMTSSNPGSWLWQDLKYGARLLRLNPGFAATAIVSLALGGASLERWRLNRLPDEAHPV